ncbi:hypothetical protein ABT275_03445 [Streptomyces sp. NPDC001185]|uniref:hypothetical protein n=1 Tax=Streptomyces sp. NPDC001185 TaxID=3154380 RepID=UPI00331AF258
MTNLKIALEADDASGLRRGADQSGITVHAYDVEAGRFPFHRRGHDHTIIYDVRPDLDWPATGLIYKTCRTCPDCESGSLMI